MNGPSSTTYVGGMPLAMAAVYTNGLKPDPAWRSAWVARLNFERPKSRPPILARTDPLHGSRAMKSPSTYLTESGSTTPAARESW